MLRYCARTLLNCSKLKIKPLNSNKIQNYMLDIKHIKRPSYGYVVIPKTENDYAYNIIQKLNVINRDIFPPLASVKKVTTVEEFDTLLDQNWRTRTGSEIVNTFGSVANFCAKNNINFSDTRFDQLTDGLMDQVLELTDDELSNLLTCLKEFPFCDSYNSHNYHDIWSALDDVCCSRINKWSNETKFLFADHFYRLNLGKFSDFVYMVTDKLSLKAKFLTKTELVYLFYLIKSHKRVKAAFNVIFALDIHIKELSIEELSFIAGVLVKLEIKPKFDNTIQQCIDVLNNTLPVATEIQICNIIDVRKTSKFTTLVLQNLDVSRLTKNELIHACFHINVCRSFLINEVLYQNVLSKYIKQLSVSEIGIIAMAYFKTKTIFKSNYLINLIISKVNKDVHSVHEITLSAILKFLRYSTKQSFVDQLINLLDNLVPEIPRLSNVCCVHIALLGTTLHFFHEKSLQAVCNKLIKDINDASKVRLKDMERLLVALTMFNYDPKTSPDFYESIFNELHTENRRMEYYRYHRSLLTTLQLLSMRKLYSHTLMNDILDMDKVYELYGKQSKMVPISLFYLDTCIDIDCPDYKGNRLNKDFRRKGLKWSMSYFPRWDQFRKLTQVDKFTLNVKDIVSIIAGGDDFLYIDHILPNYVTADIIVCKDEHGNFVKPNGFDQYLLGDVMKAPNPKLKWYSIIPINWNSQIKQTREPLGLKVTKCQQLQTIGYEPILIHWNEFNVSENEQIQLIRDKLTKL